MIRAGLIGFGVAGSAFHGPLIAADPRITLAAVASARPDAVHARHPGVQVVDDAAALFADPAIDLIVVATPNALHAPLARRALMEGKHVVIDKPFVADAADGAALIDLAAGRGRMLSVFHNRRWDGDFLTVAKVLAGGTLGDIRLAEFCWDRFRPVPRVNWREEPGDGAGLLADLGPHMIDQAIRLFGMPDGVSGDVLTQRDGVLVDDAFDLMLRYGATRVRVAASTLVADARPRFALHGTRGSYVKHGIDPQEAVLRAGGAPTDDGYGVEPAADWGRITVGDTAAQPVPSERGDWRCFYAGVAAAILDGAPPPVDAADALAGLRIIDLARRSSADGCTLPYRGA